MTPFQPVSDPLSMPVGSLVAHHDPVQSGTSVRVAGYAMAESGLHALLVAQGRRLVGVVDEQALLGALSSGLDPNSPVDAIMDREPAKILTHMSGAEALRVFHETGRHAIAVVDVLGDAVGVLTPSRLYQVRRPLYRPQSVGGLATPFGVYLTNGIVSGGAGGFAVAASGAVLFLVFFFAMLLVVAAVNLSGLDAAQAGAQGWMEFSATALFLVGLRAIPLSGTHGAEHMVVHAMERGEELTLEVVRRMPRVHPRCGTNIAVGFMMFLGLSQSEWIPQADVRLLVAVFVTLFLWRPVGSLVQYVFTTRPPTNAQLAGGIRAAQQLLSAAERSPRASSGTLRRIASSGILQVMLGATVAQFVVYGAMTLLDLPESWQVLSMSG